MHRAAWPTEAEFLETIGGAADEPALAALMRASEITASIRRERSLRKMAFGVPVQALRLPETGRNDWPTIAADVLAGNNASEASVRFGEEFGVDFGPLSSTPGRVPFDARAAELLEELRPYG